MPDNDNLTAAAALPPGLLDCPPEILDLTLDQLRTLTVVHAVGSAQRAAQALGREQSSVQKQLDILNRAATRLIGEALVVKQGRGKDFLFTLSGKEITDLAYTTLRPWTDVVHRARRRVGSTITVGTTEFTVEFLADIWPTLAEEFDRRAITLRVEHVRTRDLAAKLDAKDVDLVCGSLATRRGEPPVLDYDFTEWHREGVALLTNLSPRELPDRPVTMDTLPTLPLLAPTAGLLAGFLAQWYGPDYRGVLTVVADIDSLNYGLRLLDARLLHGCLLTTELVAHAALEGRLPGDSLRIIPLAGDFHPALEIVTGLFARRDERARYAPDHPLNLLWNTFRDHAPTAVAVPPELPR
ncbi:hypothetical protein GCM10010174_03420 [Kutzneria viridogrisea]|uniref:DNA-binding transcriptional LysR family regulator n=1 Tax=Kutzneria viridogrisea TaxID=47990 RepID=A0ABR6BRE0_9PSEU|nr:DNA-binding transcriptional LysR family regulator [Kutzneria viridogrisea]